MQEIGDKKSCADFAGPMTKCCCPKDQSDCLFFEPATRGDRCLYFRSDLEDGCDRLHLEAI